MLSKVQSHFENTVRLHSCEMRQSSTGGIIYIYYMSQFLPLLLFQSLGQYGFQRRVCEGKPVFLDDDLDVSTVFVELHCDHMNQWIQCSARVCIRWIAKGMSFHITIAVDSINQWFYQAVIIVILKFLQEDLWSLVFWFLNYLPITHKHTSSRCVYYRITA